MGTPGQAAEKRSSSHLLICAFERLSCLAEIQGGSEISEEQNKDNRCRYPVGQDPLSLQTQALPKKGPQNFQAG